MLAETNRAPFDSPEAEAELVAGYNIEYSPIIFALSLSGEHCNMLLMSTLLVILFLGGRDTGFYNTIFNFFNIIIFISYKILILLF